MSRFRSIDTPPPGKSRVLFQSSLKDPRTCFQSGVSLHGHTRHSVESLSFLRKFLDRSPVLRPWIKFQRERGRRRTGIPLDLDRAHWTPPLCERQAYELEAGQIEALGLRAMVSLSDHDTIAGCALLRRSPETQDSPISMEWTIAFGKAVFHIGVHNLPEREAPCIMAALLAASSAGSESTTLKLLAELNRMGVLLVFNHPLWNLNGIPSALFASELSRFLKSAKSSLHAFELNGMRSYQENLAVVRLAAQWDQVLISGGDRHGCEPNAAINLTNATDFAEFVDEIRSGRQSTVLLMPQYQEPLNWRIYKSFTHVIASYPGHPEERRSWDQRIFHPDLDGKIVPVIDLWDLGPPTFLKNIFAFVMLSGRVPLPEAVDCCREIGGFIRAGFGVKHVGESGTTGAAGRSSRATVTIAASPEVRP